MKSASGFLFSACAFSFFVFPLARQFLIDESIKEQRKNFFFAVIALHYKLNYKGFFVDGNLNKNAKRFLCALLYAFIAVFALALAL